MAPLREKSYFEIVETVVVVVRATLTSVVSGTFSIVNLTRSSTTAARMLWQYYLGKKIPPATAPRRNEES